VDGGDSVASVADARQSVRSLEPSLLEVLVEDAFSVTVSNSRAQDVDLELGLGVDGSHSERF
jgi:hypothetical protein